MTDTPALKDVSFMHDALLSAVRRLGSQEKLASVCGCTTPNIWQLIRRKSALPARFVLKVEGATGISRHDLRPDLYPSERAPSADTNIAA